MPTKAVCAEHLELRNDILTLLNLQKQVTITSLWSDEHPYVAGARLHSYDLYAISIVFSKCILNILIPVYKSGYNGVYVFACTIISCSTKMVKVLLIMMVCLQMLLGHLWFVSELQWSVDNYTFTLSTNSENIPSISKRSNMLIVGL